MIVRLERTVPFARDAVYAWWTDFQPDDHPGRPSPATSSREIVRRQGNEVWLRDRAVRPAPVALEEKVILDPPHGYTVEARYPGADVRYGYRFEPEGEATRIRLEATVTPRHFGHLLLPLVRGRVLRYAVRDTDYHLRRMTQDLAGGAGAVTSPASPPGRTR
jgi:hypothetical protein